LSLLSRAGVTGIQTRRVAILVGTGVSATEVNEIYMSLLIDGAVPRLVGIQLGKIATSDKGSLDIEISLEAGPAVLYDAVIIPDGDGAVKHLLTDAHSLDFVRQQYRHCKPILAFGSGIELITKADIPTTFPDGSIDQGLIIAESAQLKNAINAFKTALAGHRSFAREMDPPKV